MGGERGVLDKVFDDNVNFSHLATFDYLYTTLRLFDKFCNIFTDFYELSVNFYTVSGIFPDFSTIFVNFQ